MNTEWIEWLIEYGNVAVENMPAELAEQMTASRNCDIECRNKLADWMIQRGFSTGHGDTMDDLLNELDIEIADRIAKAREPSDDKR